VGNGQLCERGKGRKVIAPLSKCRDERSEFYGRKEGKGRFEIHCRLPVVNCGLKKISSILRVEDKGDGG